jgi:hypothetical protein
MVVSIQMSYTLYCNVCHRVGPGAMGGDESRQEARRHARKAGWKRVPKGSVDDKSWDRRGEDLCPVCARQRGLK